MAPEAMADPREQPGIPDHDRGEQIPTSWHANADFNEVTKSPHDPPRSPRAALKLGHLVWEIWHEHLKFRREISRYPDETPPIYDLVGPTGSLFCRSRN